MQKIYRPELPNNTKKYLESKQKAVLSDKNKGVLNMEGIWKGARQTKVIQPALKLLRQAAGKYERCMYCVDSHGTDIEHFRPKTPYPDYSFQWSNWLLCCTECGRIKGSQFPMEQNQPLLIDPTIENPWRYIDFDPDTGNLMARFDLNSNDWFIKGQETVRVLQFDRREALSSGYQKTFLRLSRTVQAALEAPSIVVDTLLKTLEDEDDHGLLGWCFGVSGQKFTPFLELSMNHPEIWAVCKHKVV